MLTTEAHAASIHRSSTNSCFSTFMLPQSICNFLFRLLTPCCAFFPASEDRSIGFFTELPAKSPAEATSLTEAFVDRSSRDPTPEFHRQQLFSLLQRPIPLLDASCQHLHFFLLPAARSHEVSKAGAACVFNRVTHEETAAASYLLQQLDANTCPTNFSSRLHKASQSCCPSVGC